MNIEKLNRIIDKYQNQKNALVGLLQDLTAEYKYIPKEALQCVSERLQIPLSQLYSIATFYKAFRLQPRGKHEIFVCMGTACHVRGASRIVESLERELKIKSGETTKDGNFTLETVNCLGACALGPLVVIDGEYHGKMNSSKLIKLLKKYENKKSD